MTGKPLSFYGSHTLMLEDVSGEEFRRRISKCLQIHGLVNLHQITHVMFSDGAFGEVEDRRTYSQECHEVKVRLLPPNPISTPVLPETMQAPRLRVLAGGKA